MDIDKLKIVINESKTRTEVLDKMGMKKRGWDYNSIKIIAEKYKINTSHLLKRHARKYTKEMLSEIIYNSKSYAEVCRKLGISYHGGNVNLFKRRTKEYELDTSHFVNYHPNTECKTKYTEEILRPIVERNKNYSQVCKELGLKVCGGNIDYIKNMIKKYNINTLHFTGWNHPRKYTKEVLSPIIVKSKSYSEVCQELNLKNTGGNLKLLQKRIKEYKIDTSHFLGRNLNNTIGLKGRCGKNSYCSVLTLNNKLNKRLASQLRTALIDSGREYKCDGNGCQIDNIWLNKEITLQIHHINGDNYDDRAENLQFLCPNCHSQTKNWCSRNRKKNNILLVS